MINQQGDVKLFQTLDDGDIIVEGGIVTMGGGLETAFYLSLFGGNEDDNGLDDSTDKWWGNLDEEDPDKQYVSETQHLLKSLPLITGNLNRVKEAVVRDLAWAIPSVATSIDVSVTIPEQNKVQITITVDGDTTVTFILNWKQDLEDFVKG